MTALIKSPPWNTAAFGIPTWELTEYTENAMQLAVQTPGHHAIKVNPLVDKRLLHEYGFYYCDTLIEPHCDSARLRRSQHPDASISEVVDAESALAICHGAFVYDRFHRDFSLSKAGADWRYDNWLKQLLGARQVYGLYWQGVLAGFIGHRGNNLVLHAVAEQFRGKGLSKYWWSLVCSELLASGHGEVSSSISASNLAVLNLYASLGFAFNDPQDVYHRLVP